ncbi:hypothetical protein M758_12G120300 [Ceratodon purpureus]|nr:hypothetical protein M758_12G120300 [Ceratodon purpureus]
MFSFSMRQLSSSPQQFRRLFSVMCHRNILQPTGLEILASSPSPSSETCCGAGFVAKESFVSSLVHQHGLLFDNQFLVVARLRQHRHSGVEYLRLTSWVLCDPISPDHGTSGLNDPGLICQFSTLVPLQRIFRFRSLASTSKFSLWKHLLRV